MPKLTAINYLRSYLIALFLLIAAVVSFNIIIDPFGVYYLIDLQGFNNVKAGQGAQARMGKAGSDRVVRPRGVVLGNSRAEYGINPEHPGWTAAPVYNLAISGSNIYEILRYFQHAHGVQKLEQALLMLDLNQFSAYWDNAVDFDEDRLSVTLDEEDNTYYYLHDFVPTTLSLKALSQSLNTIMRSYLDRPTTYLANGQRDWHDDLLFKSAIGRYGSYHNLFRVEESSLFAAKSKKHSSPYIESPYNPETNVNVYDWFRRILRIAIRENIDLRLVINPSHARYFESHRLMGSWYLWEEWKRDLVRIVEEEAALAGVQAFPLWDFSGFNQLTTERVPSPDDKKTRMEWYFESSHYTTDMGDLVQDRVFGHNEPGREVPEYFGVMLTGGNIEEHIANIRESNRLFREQQPHVAKELANLVAKYDIIDNHARDISGNNITFKW